MYLLSLSSFCIYVFFFCNHPATTEIYTYVHTLSLHVALPSWKRQHHERTYRKGGKPRLAHQKAVVDEAGEVDDDQDREGNVPEVSGQSHRRRGLALFAGEGPADKVTERRAHPQDRGQSHGDRKSTRLNSSH